ncbi:MAG TPA: hypothetical protein VLE72_02325 [Candidatus Saccharimonadales bacterium]|nr:hypothetical protein [Candidatus Saccharimonadales bacterium]
MPKTKTKSNGLNLTKRLNFNKGQLIAIIVAGVVIGGYVAYKTFAAGPATVTGCKTRVNDPTYGPLIYVHFTVRKYDPDMNIAVAYKADKIKTYSNGYVIDRSGNWSIIQQSGFNSNNRAYMNGVDGSVVDDPYWEVDLFKPGWHWGSYAHHVSWLPFCGTSGSPRNIYIDWGHST